MLIARLSWRWHWPPTCPHMSRSRSDPTSSDGSAVDALEAFCAGSDRRLTGLRSKSPDSGRIRTASSPHRGAVASMDRPTRTEPAAPLEERQVASAICGLDSLDQCRQLFFAPSCTEKGCHLASRSEPAGSRRPARHIRQGSNRAGRCEFVLAEQRSQPPLGVTDPGPPRRFSDQQPLERRKPAAPVRAATRTTGSRRDTSPRR